MQSNLGEVILNQLIGALIGTIVSFITSWYFYKKADFPSRTSGEMTETLLAMMIGLKMGVDFNLYKEIPKKDYPKNSDIPHIIRFYTDKNETKSGDSVTMLFRVEDSGFNLEYMGEIGIEVIESSSNVGFPIERQGHGFYSCKVQFPKNALSGSHTIMFNLADKKGYKYSQVIKYVVV